MGVNPRLLFIPRRSTLTRPLGSVFERECAFEELWLPTLFSVEARARRFHATDVLCGT